MLYKIVLNFDSLSENEAFARISVASFCANKIKDLESINDIKTAVSEAVTNAIVHGYHGIKGEISINCIITDNEITIDIIDNGVGIEDIDIAQKPFYTSKPEMERSGMGFTVMKEFMDKMEVVSEIGKGTKVTLIKNIK